MQKTLLFAAGPASIFALQSGTCLGQDNPDFTTSGVHAALLVHPRAATTESSLSEGKCDPTKLIDGPNGPEMQKGTTAGVAADMAAAANVAATSRGRCEPGDHAKPVRA